MDERTVKKAFESLGPSDEARQRMLDHILSAQEAQEAAPAEAPQSTHALATQPAQRRRQATRFSPIRYALPIAACLILAVITPLTLPRLMSSFEQPTLSSSAETAPSSSATERESSSATATEEATPNASAPSSTQQDSSQSDGASKDHQDATAVAPSANVVAEAPQTQPAHTNSTNNFVDIIVFLLPLVFCLIAFAIAFAGVFSWRRIKRRNASTKHEDETHL